MTLLQGLCVCAHCGYGMGRNSGSGGRGGRRLHYYRCYGTEHWRYPQGAVCDNPAVRAEDIDDAVWQEMLTLLQHPELIQTEIERRLVAANDTASPRRRIESLQGELSRIQTRFRRLLDAYQEGIVTLDELRRRNAPLQTRQCSIRSELEALQTSELDRESQLALATTIQQFLQRLRQAAAGALHPGTPAYRASTGSRSPDREGFGHDPSFDPAQRLPPTGSILLRVSFPTPRGHQAAADF